MSRKNVKNQSGGISFLNVFKIFEQFMAKPSGDDFCVP